MFYKVAEVANTVASLGLHVGLRQAIKADPVLPKIRRKGRRKNICEHA